MKKTISVSLIVFISITLLGLEGSASAQERDFSRDRETMVQAQIEARGIKDKRVLEAMRKVKRHLFVPSEYRHLSYEDMPLPIGEGQTISQPYIVALMTELLALKGNENVLEIGTGSGYQAAILAELAKEVYTIEILEPLATRAEKLLKELNYNNIWVRCSDGYLGWPEHAPFDAIIVTCAPQDIPLPLVEQLVEGGRLVIPVGPLNWQELKLLVKKGGKLEIISVIPVRFVPMLRDKEDEPRTRAQERGEFKSKKQDEEMSEMIENLKKHTIVLSKEIGERNFLHYQNLEDAYNYIRQQLRNYGYQPQEQVYHMENKPFRNLIATKKGRTSPDKIIVVCAHYDSVMGSPGADDNASGVAGLLELAQLLYEEDLNRTVEFIAFSNEEPPLFMTADMGSLRYAQEAKRSKKEILAVLCIESIGFYSENKKSQSYPLGLSFFYPEKANFIAIVSNLSSSRLLKRIISKFKKISDFPVEYLIAPSSLVPAIGFSDNWSFWRFGYKAVMITDTAFYRNLYYHTYEDTFEKLNYEYMSKVIKGLYGVILDLAS